MPWSELWPYFFLRESLDSYDPRSKPNAVLADDARILAAWWSTGVRPKREILDCLVRILREIARRKKEGRMNWTLHLERVKDPELWRQALAELRPEEREVLTAHIDSPKGRAKR